MASTDSVAQNTGFAEKNGATFPILSDPSKDVVKAYGALHPMGFASRWTFYIDAEGVIAKIDKDVKPLTAGATLARNLAELGVPAASAGEAADAGDEAGE